MAKQNTKVTRPRLEPSSSSKLYQLHKKDQDLNRLANNAKDRYQRALKTLISKRRQLLTEIARLEKETKPP